MSDKVKGEIKADQKIVTELTLFMEQGLKTWLKEHPETRLLDVFMAAHSLHKVIIFEVAKRWAMEGVPEKKTYHMADLTFRRAMRDLRLG